jgi:hypothetical protein
MQQAKLAQAGEPIWLASLGKEILAEPMQQAKLAQAGEPIWLASLGKEILAEPSKFGKQSKLFLVPPNSWSHQAKLYSVGQENHACLSQRRPTNLAMWRCLAPDM